MRLRALRFLRAAFSCALPIGAALLIFCPTTALGRGEVGPQSGSGPGDIQTLKILDGRYVHNVGELQLNVTNWGVLGSFPGSGWDMSDAPSAQWPAGSGVEHLYAAGLWLGGRIAGIPRVTTAYPDFEFYPGDEKFSTLFTSRQGVPGGERLPSPRADDDGDGRRDEDPINGLDDDGDGLVDEDYAATSNQMFRCTYNDFHAEVLADSPDHQPLNVKVIQETYQWEHDLIDDLVGIEYTVINAGRENVNEFYMGFFADPDIGSRLGASNYRDDETYIINDFFCIYRRPFNMFVRMQMGVAFDGDGDPESSIPAPGHFGILLLGHTTDPLAQKASPIAYLRNWQSFAGLMPYAEGGDPVSDQQRYELMSSFGYDNPGEKENDYRMLLSTGPFRFAPGDTLKLQLGLIVGGSREELMENAIEAIFTFDGLWYDADEDEETGIDCNEHLLYDLNQNILWFDPCDPLADPVTVPRGSKLWVNADCMDEEAVQYYCDNVLEYCTGIDGKETRVRWLYESPPVPPNMRVWPAENQNVLFWDNLSEMVPDLKRGDFDFEGYKIWRADNWTRPFGTSEANGPPSNLWSLLGEYDVINQLGYDLGLESIRYQPNIDANLVAHYETILMESPDLVSALDYLPPHGYTVSEADTAIAIAKHRLGLPGGKVYYSFADPYTTTGMPYFYSVTATDHVPHFDSRGKMLGYFPGVDGGPATNFIFTVPQTASQPAWDYDENEVYVVPNPASRDRLAPWSLQPNNSDPAGTKIEFHHLPAARSTVRIFTLAGDHVATLIHDPSPGLAHGNYESTGTLTWNMISRKGQEIASGVYIFTVEAEGFPQKTGKFTVIR